MKINKLANFPFWIICGAFVLGVFCATFFKVDFFNFIILLFVIAIALLFSLKKKQQSVLFLILSSVLFFCIGMVRYTVSQPSLDASHIVNAVLKETPQQVVFRITDVFKASEKYSKFKVSMSAVSNKKTNGYALLSIRKDKDELPPLLGETYVGYLPIHLLKNTATPYAFNYTDYLNSRHITHQIWAAPNQLLRLDVPQNFFVKTSNKLKTRLETQLRKQELLPEVRQITEALVLGNKSAINPQLNTDFANAGVIHILAISGLHIGIIYWLLMGMFKKALPYAEHQILRSVFILCCLWAFVWFSGGSPSAIRATTMFSCFELARLLVRRQHPINSLFVTVFVVLFADPYILFSVGFQLSVTAVAAIIIGMPIFLAWWSPKNYVLRKVWGIISVSTCAQLGLLPLSVYYFHQIPGLFLVANIPIMLVITGILIVAIIVVVWSGFGILPLVIASFYNSIISEMNTYIHWVAIQEDFILKDLYMQPITLVFCYLLLVVLLFMYTKPKWLYRYSLPIASVALVISFWEMNHGRFKKEVWLMNHYTNTIITEITSENVAVHHLHSLDSIDLKYNVLPIAGSLHTDYKTHQLKYSYQYNGNQIHVISSASSLPLNAKNSYLILTDSPKINLERIIENQHPKVVIATVHNYRNRIKKWKATCDKHQVAFYSIQEKGSINLASY